MCYDQLLAMVMLSQKGQISFIDLPTVCGCRRILDRTLDTAKTRALLKRSIRHL